MVMRHQVVPISLFYSYAHEDEPLREQLEKHLHLLRRQGFISQWHDRQIMPGAEWMRDVDEHLNTASIILLLISPDFLASDYCYDVEMQRALKRHEHGETRVIPIILRPCDWRNAPFGHLQCLPRDGKSVTEWNNPDAAFLEIAQGVRQAVQQLPDLARLTSSVSSLGQRYRMRLIKQVRTIWIDGLLEQSLHQAALLALHLQEQPDALANPWRLFVQEIKRATHSLPAETSIVQVYDEADCELLILGEPGAGKTSRIRCLLSLISLPGLCDSLLLTGSSKNCGPSTRFLIPLGKHG